jgi:hypothetical protein
MGFCLDADSLVIYVPLDRESVGGPGRKAYTKMKNGILTRMSPAQRR